MPDKVKLDEVLQETTPATPAIQDAASGVVFARPKEGVIPGFVEESPESAAQATMAAAREELYGGAGQTALTGVEGGLGALTFGGSDWLLKALGADTADRAKTNPYARAVGEIGTTVGATFLSGGLAGGTAIGAVGRGLARATPLGALSARTGRLAASVGGVKGLIAAESLEGLASAAGAEFSKLAISDEEFTAKSALLNLGLGTVVGGAAGATVGGLQKVAGGLRGKTKGVGVDLSSVEGKDFAGTVSRGLSDLEAADNAITRNVAVGRKAEAAGQAYVRNLKDDHLVRSQLEFLEFGENIEQGAVDILTKPPTRANLVETNSARLLGAGEQPTAKAVSRIADLPDEALAGNARNIKQYIDEVAEENLDYPGAVGTAEYKALVQTRKELNALVNPKGEGFGTSATKGRSNLPGPETDYELRVDVGQLRNGLQKYYDRTVALGRKLGFSDAEERILGGAPAQSGRGFAAAFDSEPGTYTSTSGGLRGILRKADTPDEGARRAAMKSDFRSQAAGRDTYAASAAAQTAARREAALAAEERFAQEVDRYDRVMDAYMAADRSGKAFRAAGGFGDTVTLGANPGEAVLRAGAAQDYFDDLTRLAAETGREVPEVFAKRMASLQEELTTIGARGTSGGPLSGDDLRALRAGRSAFKKHNWNVEHILKLPEEKLVAQLSDLDAYFKGVQKAGSKVAIPGLVEHLDGVSAELTRRLESVTKLSASDVDKAYSRLMEIAGGPPVDFKGPAADLHKLWAVNQALQEGGKLGSGIMNRLLQAQGVIDKTATGRSRALQAGLYRLAGSVARKTANAVGGGPLVGAMVSGVAARRASDLFSQQKGILAFLSGATGGMLQKIATAADIGSKAARHVGLNVGSVTRHVSFDPEHKPSTKETSEQTYLRLATEVTSLVTDPATQVKLNDALGFIREISWGVGDKMEMMVLDAVKYLHEALPKDPGFLQKWGKSTWKPTSSEMYTWLAKVAAVADPINSIQRFMRGGGSPAEADAIRNVHGDLFARFQEHLLENIAAMRTSVPAATRVRLAVLFDAPIDSRLRPEFRQFMKQHWTDRAADQEPVDVAAGAAQPTPTTPAQRMLS